MDGTRSFGQAGIGRARTCQRGALGDASHASHDTSTNKGRNANQHVVGWHPLFRTSHGLMFVGGGGVQTLPFYLGTAYNVCSMEDIEICLLLC